MRILCVMPIFGRPEITTETIGMLQKQHLAFDKIIVVGSSLADAAVAADTGCAYLNMPNHPLSNKVQAGVNLARSYEPDAILLTGSDSWLTLDYVAKCANQLSRGVQLVGKRQINVASLYCKEPLKLLSCAYTVRADPIGAGRAIAASALKLLDWQVFPSGLERGLDSASFDRLRKVIRADEIHCFANNSNPAILEIKSDAWSCLTQMSSIVGSRTLAIDTVELDWIGDNFPNGLKILKKLVPTAIL
jgi:hypothetical protein